MFFRLFFFGIFVFCFIFSNKVSNKTTLYLFSFLKEIEKNDNLLSAYRKSGKAFKKAKEYIWHTTFFPTLNSGGSISQSKVPFDQTNYSGNLSLNALLPIASTRFSLGGSVGYQLDFFTRNYLWAPSLDLSVSQPILRDGILPALFVNRFRSKIEQQIEIDSLIIEYNEVDTDRRLNKLYYDNIIDFFQYRYYQELLKILKEIKDNSEKLYLFNRNRNKKRIIGDSEYLQSEINYLTLKQSYDSTQEDFKKLKFKIMLNLGYTRKDAEKKKLNLVGNFFSRNSLKLNESQFFELSLKKRKDVRNTQIEINKKDMQIKNAINDTLPKLDLGFGLNWKGKGEEFDESLEGDFLREFKASFSFSAYLSPVAYTQMDLYRLEKEQLQHRLSGVEKSLKINIKNGILSIKQNSKNLETNLKTYRLRKKLYLSLKKDYENGRIDYRFFIDGINNYRNSYQSYLNSVLQYQFSIIKFYYDFADMGLYINNFLQREK